MKVHKRSGIKKNAKSILDPNSTSLLNSVKIDTVTNKNPIVLNIISNYNI